MSEWSHTDMEDGRGKLDMPKVSRTLGHALIAGGAFEGTVDGSKVRIVQAAFARLHLLFVL